MVEWLVRMSIKDYILVFSVHHETTALAPQCFFFFHIRCGNCLGKKLKMCF